MRTTLDAIYGALVYDEPVICTAGPDRPWGHRGLLLRSGAWAGKALALIARKWRAMESASGEIPGSSRSSRVGGE
jgi:hypothetical protein